MARSGCSLFGRLSVSLKPSALSINRGRVSNQTILLFTGSGRPTANVSLYSGATCTGVAIGTTTVYADEGFAVSPTAPHTIDGAYNVTTNADIARTRHRTRRFVLC